MVSLRVFGNTLYSTGYDKMLLDWDVEVQTPIFFPENEGDECKHVRSRYLNKRGGVWCMVFSHDGSILYTGGHDRKLMAWSSKVISPSCNLNLFRIGRAFKSLRATLGSLTQLRSVATALYFLHRMMEMFFHGIRR